MNKGLEKHLTLKEKIQRHYEYLIQESIDNGEYITQCCVTGLVRAPDGEFIEFQFKEPYNKVSHGYCPAEYEKMMEQIRAMPTYGGRWNG